MLLTRALPTYAARSMATVHGIAQSGFAEGTNDLYDRARPSYPASALQFIAQAVGAGPGGGSYIEPGAGTGIFSRLLLSAPSADYPAFRARALVGVEPSAGMRAAWERGLARVPAADLAGVDARAVDGAFDDYSHTLLERGAADGVLIAQAWHWCQDYDRALREAAAYLKPGAPLVLLWNLETRDGYQGALRDYYQPFDLGTPQYYRMRWRAMVDTPAYAELFEPLEETKFAWSSPVTEDGVVDRVLSKSYLTEAHLNGERRVEFERRLREIIRNGDKEWVDEENGVFQWKSDTDVVVLRKRQ
ncbi:hypothetical protein Q8F55_005710 [Vanrija albida]|uniref:Methyltransferase type 11 domain-containing protein n=1 Tax=Vanrija albida TaxID=181172 RepID=A0ABR3Q2F0_9TREE